MLQYNVTGGHDPSALALVTVDSPQVILAIDPMFALLNFAMSPFKNSHVEQESEDLVQIDAVMGQDVKPKTTGPPFAFRVEVVQSTIMVLADDTDSKSQAIQLNIKNVVLAQQVSKRVSSAVNRQMLLMPIPHFKEQNYSGRASVGNVFRTNGYPIRASPLLG